MAKKLEGKLKTQALEKKLLGLNQAPLIDDVWKKYLEWAKKNKKSWKDDQERWGLHIEPTLKGKKMDAVIPYDVSKLIDNMKKKRDYAPATIKQVMALVKRIYNWASDMGLYEGGQNPAAKIKAPKVNNEVTECLTRDEIKRLFQALDKWWNQRVALLIKFALYTGVRRGEIFGLRWEEVDLHNGVINLKDTKGGKDEAVPISDEALEILKRAKGLLPTNDCPYAFPNRWGMKRRSLGNTWTYLKKSAKIPKSFRFHGLRHTFASYLASSGKVSQFTLQKLLTHKTPNMTQRYAHLFDQTLREGANMAHELYFR
jgi:integrase